MLHAEHEQVSIAVEQLLYKKTTKITPKKPLRPSLSALFGSTTHEYWKLSLKAKNWAAAADVLAGKNSNSGGNTRGFLVLLGKPVLLTTFLNCAASSASTTPAPAAS